MSIITLIIGSFLEIIAAALLKGRRNSFSGELMMVYGLSWTLFGLVMLFTGSGNGGTFLAWITGAGILAAFPVYLWVLIIAHFPRFSISRHVN